MRATGAHVSTEDSNATHWRLYSPAEVAELCKNMGGEIELVTSFLKTEPFSLKSRLFLAAINFLRRRSRNGTCSHGQHIHVIARKHSDAEIYRPQWLFPDGFRENTTQFGSPRLPTATT